MGIEDWDRIGLSVQESARRLHRIGYVDRMLMRLEAGHVAARPEYEVKGALARLCWQDANHSDQLRNRCRQLRMSTKAYDKCPEAELEALMEAALRSPGTLALLKALFEVIKPAQVKSIHRYLEAAQPLVDEPTIQMLRGQLHCREEQLAWGRLAIEALAEEVSPEEVVEADLWSSYLSVLLAAAGEIDGTSSRIPVDPGVVRSAPPFELPQHSTRDARFRTSVKKFRDIPFSDDDHSRFEMMMYTRFFEMSPAEGIAHVHFSTLDKPWVFYLDTARHLWDEVRHAWFGEAALRLKGYNISDVPNWTGWYDMTANLFDSDEAYTHLTIAIEKAAMKYPPGKREEWEFCRDVIKDPHMTTFQDFDWADEVVHAGFGQRWIIDELYKGDNVKATAAADATNMKRAEFMRQFQDESQEPASRYAGGY